MSHCLLVVLVRLASTKLVVAEFDILSVECRVINQSQRNVHFLSGKQLIALLASMAEYDQCLAHLLLSKIIYYTSAAVAVDSSHMTASSSASWSGFSPPLNFVNGQTSTMWFVIVITNGKH